MSLLTNEQVVPYFSRSGLFVNPPREQMELVVYSRDRYFESEVEPRYRVELREHRYAAKL